MITLTTIGFGDFVAGELCAKILHGKNSSIDKITVNFIFEYCMNNTADDT